MIDARSSIIGFVLSTTTERPSFKACSMNWISRRPAIIPEPVLAGQDKGGGEVRPVDGALARALQPDLQNDLHGYPQTRNDRLSSGRGQHWTAA
jgi:hypothetical protein